MTRHHHSCDLIVHASTPPASACRLSGGKAGNLAHLYQLEIPTAPWFALSKDAFELFIKCNQLEPLLLQARLFTTACNEIGTYSQRVEKAFLQASFPPQLGAAIEQALELMKLENSFLAVRSSGLDEDGLEHSFAGQFSSFLYRQGMPSLQEAIKLCWSSAYSERALSYRLQHQLPLYPIALGIVIQKMVNSEIAGVGFSRNPMDLSDRDHLIIDAVLGQGEGLVSGLLDADHYCVNRATLDYSSTLAEKSFALQKGPLPIDPSEEEAFENPLLADHNGKGASSKDEIPTGLVKVNVEKSRQLQPTLTRHQIEELTRLMLELESKLGQPQDCEWAYENNQLYCLQTRPITTLPPDALFDRSICGDKFCLWDNSNIIESYCGITSPLTFSFAQSSYTQVYRQFCEVIGIPESVIQSHALTFRNMLGLVRGRIYYNLFNWYQLVQLLPGSSHNAGFMETMLGVKQSLKDDLSQALAKTESSFSFSWGAKCRLWSLSLYRFIKLDQLVAKFMHHFDTVYQEQRRRRYDQLSLGELVQTYHYLEENILKKWQEPIINDCFCMVFFGLLKKITERWIPSPTIAKSLPNDLLCGQGDLASAEPTKRLMALAQRIDQDKEMREWLLQSTPESAWSQLKNGEQPWLKQQIDEYLDSYGFRCINELKLEEPTLHDNPSFLLDTLMSYLRLKNYSVEQMHLREKAILEKAEASAKSYLFGLKRSVYFWVLLHARQAIAHRENLRFARTKIFGVIRNLFRAIGNHLHKLGLIDQAADVFFLTIDEIFAFIEGRSCNLDLRGLIALRKQEYDSFAKEIAPPDRFLTQGAAGASMLYPLLLASNDLSRNDLPISDDPSKLYGVPCCPGVVQGVVRVVTGMDDAGGLKGEILVAERTDPGWVPLYPSCSGLLIERGSLLSHSAVVARELGLPTIVGISGGLLKRLKTGQQVRMDGSTGEIQILGD